ncbi:SIMPL domain-containing protein [Pseudocolwellia agarivorans]|uniref:SIMPL domain-containing protein n=1 Tax=Pseudocolwellia agarivorans TaxID=1911682 RepID=UPI003F882D07
MRYIIALLGCMSFFAAAASLPDVPHFYVKGTGKITVVPDTAQVSFSIVTRSKDLVEAKKEADTLSAAVIKIAKDYKLDAKDISASELYIQRETQYDNITRKQVFIGHKVTRSVQLYLKDLSRYSYLVQSLVNAGITEMQGVKLMASNIDELTKKASLLAIADAKEAAKELAKGFEVNLGQLYRASAEAIRGEAAYSSSAMMSMKRDSAPANIVNGAFEPGSIDVVQSIYAVYLID